MIVAEEQDLIFQKKFHLKDEYAEKIQDLLSEYEDVIVGSFEHIRRSKSIPNESSSSQAMRLSFR